MILKIGELHQFGVHYARGVSNAWKSVPNAQLQLAFNFILILIILQFCTSNQNNNLRRVQMRHDRFVRQNSLIL